MLNNIITFIAQNSAEKDVIKIAGLFLIIGIITVIFILAGDK